MIQFILVLLLLTSCQRSQWAYRYIAEKNHNYTRLTYHSQDRVQGIDIEFLCNGKNLTTYLQVAAQKIPDAKNSSKHTHILLKNGEKTHASLATIHAGGQRVHLSEISQTQLINWLQEGQSVTIRMASYEETIDPIRFSKHFKKLHHPPYILPFRLPF